MDLVIVFGFVIALLAFAIGIALGAFLFRMAP